MDIENVVDCERITLSWEELNYLVDLGVINVEDYQNNSPTIRQLRNISGHFQDVVFYGYMRQEIEIIGNIHENADLLGE